MRLFVALEIPPPLRDELDRRTKALRGGFPKARWVRSEAMHLTLAFLGDTDPERLPDLHRSLEEAGASIAPFALRLGGLGAFPASGKARVVWTSLEGDAAASSEALRTLQTAVARAVSQATGGEGEARRFHPHLTLARCKPPWPRGAVRRLVESFGDAPAETFEVTETVLLESELHPSGARYRVVRSYRLGGAS